MRDDTEGLAALARVRREDERRAGDSLRGAQAALETEERRAEAVQGYLDEYHCQTLSHLRDARRLREQRQFVTQLEQTVRAQAVQLQRARQAVEAARAQWIAARMQREAVDRLLARRAEERSRAERVAEQRQSDELSGRRAAALGSGP